MSSISLAYIRHAHYCKTIYGDPCTCVAAPKSAKQHQRSTQEHTDKAQAAHERRTKRRAKRLEAMK